jgi:hypothetical protein
MVVNLQMALPALNVGHQEEKHYRIYVHIISGIQGLLSFLVILGKMYIYHKNLKTKTFQYHIYDNYDLIYINIRNATKSYPTQ